MAESLLKLAGFAPRSEVNGPGARVVLWVQGCSLSCPGCFNPGTHDPAGGVGEPVASVLARVLDARDGQMAGITFSGGEPFQQAEAVAALAAGVRGAWPEASLMAFSGYRLEELRGAGAPPGAAALLAELDLLVDGRFDPRKPGRWPWRGSTNQRLWVLGRPPAHWPEASLGAEIQIGEDGDVLLSGFPDARLRRALSKAL